VAATPKISRQTLARLDIESLMLDAKFLRFLSTIRATAGIETVAYGPEDRHLHFAEGRRSLWCDILRTAEQAQPEALLLILTEEMKAAKETTRGRPKYERLKTDDDDGNPDAERRSEPGSGLDGYLDYGPDPAAAE
jgi:hypothetical protein